MDYKFNNNGDDDSSNREISTDVFAPVYRSRGLSRSGRTSAANKNSNPAVNINIQVVENDGEGNYRGKNPMSSMGGVPSFRPKIQILEDNEPVDLTKKLNESKQLSTLPAPAPPPLLLSDNDEDEDIYNNSNSNQTNPPSEDIFNESQTKVKAQKPDLSRYFHYQPQPQPQSNIQYRTEQKEQYNESDPFNPPKRPYKSEGIRRRILELGLHDDDSENEFESKEKEVSKQSKQSKQIRPITRPRRTSQSRSREITAPNAQLPGRFVIDSSPMPQIMGQFSRMIRDRRTRDVEQATIQQNLVSNVMQLLRDQDLTNQRIQEFEYIGSQWLHSAIQDPLYSYYVLTQDPQMNSEVYQYFLGISEIMISACAKMLEYFRDTMCPQQTNAKSILKDVSQCGDLDRQLRNALSGKHLQKKRHSGDQSNPYGYTAASITNLYDALRSPPLEVPQSILDQLFLLGETNAEESTKQQLENRFDLIENDVRILEKKAKQGELEGTQSLKSLENVPAKGSSGHRGSRSFRPTSLASSRGSQSRLATSKRKSGSMGSSSHVVARSLKTTSKSLTQTSTTPWIQKYLYDSRAARKDVRKQWKQSERRLEMLQELQSMVPSLLKFLFFHEK